MNLRDRELLAEKKSRQEREISDLHEIWKSPVIHGGLHGYFSFDREPAADSDFSEFFADPIEPSEIVVDKHGGYRNENKAWVPGWRYSSDSGKLRITTPLFEIVRQGCAAFGNVFYEFSFFKMKHRKRGQRFFRFSLVFTKDENPILSSIKFFRNDKQGIHADKFTMVENPLNDWKTNFKRQFCGYHGQPEQDDH